MDEERHYLVMGVVVNCMLCVCPGRSGNVWLSPLGCMMVSIHLRVPRDSPLGARVTFLQHIVALAAVHGIRSLPGYEVCI